jgi:hypothetical protein
VTLNKQHNRRTIRQRKLKFRPQVTQHKTQVRTLVKRTSKHNRRAMLRPSNKIRQRARMLVRLNKLTRQWNSPQTHRRKSMHPQ